MHSSSDSCGCSGYRNISRRSFGAQAALATGVLGGGWMTGLAEQLSRAAESRDGPAKSLLLIWLQGGPSQLETFDPHAGTKIGGDTRQIATSVKGLEIADCLPATAEQMHHACLVRSMVSKEGDHERATYHLKTGWRPDPTVVHPAIGSIVCRQSAENLEIPRHISITPSEWPSRGGYLGPSYDAFQIGDPAEPIPNLSGRVSPQRFASRTGRLLDVLENEFQRGRLPNMDQQRTLHQSAAVSAAKMMSSDQLSAFDVTEESESKREQFGDSAFGRGCLAAIRLLSSGVRCVEVELSGWDSHINNHEFQYSKAGVLDKALAATLSELASRGMLDDTIVCCGGEFGRTPSINPAGGRDHWPHGFSTLLAGGRFRRGYVHGATPAKIDAEKLNRPKKFDLPSLVSDPVSVIDLHATLLSALDIDYSDERITPIGRPLRWSDGESVPALLRGS